MSTKRTAARRLRVEFLEGREVPAVLTGTDPTTIDPTVPAQTGADTPPADPAPGGLNPGDGGDIMYATGSVDGTPQDPTVDLTASVAVNNRKPSLGDVVVLKVTVANKSDVQATGVTANVTLPAGLTFVSSDAGADAFDPTTGAWAAGTVAAQGSAVLTIKATVNDPGAMSVAAAVGHSDQTDDQPDNNAASADVAPVLGKLRLSQSMSANAVGVGNTVVMTVAVANPGPGKARDVVVTPALGDGLTFVRAMPSQGSYNPVTHTWKVGVVAPGTTPTLRLVTTLKKLGRIESSATATGTGFNADVSKLDATTAITGVKPGGPATWAYFAAPNFQLTPPVVAAPARSTVPSWSGQVLSNWLLLTRGFSLR